MFRALGFIFAVICILVGGGILVSEESLRLMCRTSCWLNELLFAAFGDRGGKLVLGSLWLAGGAWFMYQALRQRKRRTEAIEDDS